MNLIELCQSGYWYCEREDRIITAHMPDEEPPLKCPYCGHRTAVWHPPVLPPQYAQPSEQLP